MNLLWTARQHQKKTQRQDIRKPDGDGHMDVDPEARRRVRGKTRLIGSEQPSAPTADTSSGTTQQETEEDQDDKRRRIDEHVSTVPTAAQDEFLVPCLKTFDSVTRDDEIDVNVPLPEETDEWRKLDHRRSLLQGLTWCTTGTAAQGGEDEPVVTCRET